MAARRGERGSGVEALGRTLAAVARTRWGWTTGELEGLVTEAGWVYRAPLEGTVSCAFDAAPGRAGAFLFRDEVTAVYLVLGRREGIGLLVRRDEFMGAIDQVTESLGPPTGRWPGADPRVCWQVAAGVLEIVDRPGVLDLWLRPNARQAPRPRDARRTFESKRTAAEHREPKDRTPAKTGTPEEPAPAKTGAPEEPAIAEALAEAAAALPLGGVLELVHGTEQVAELCQEESRLIIRSGDRTRILPWPAAGSAYRKMAFDLEGEIAAGWR
jgi:hypothetical protein